MERTSCNSVFRGLIIFILIICFTACAKADLLGNMHYSKDSGAWGVSDMLKIQFYHEGPEGDPAYSSLIWYIQTSDIGSTYHLTSDNAPSFNDCTSMLTNGINDEVVMVSTIVPGGGSFTSGSESEKFVKIGFDADDFAGYEIQSIALKLNSMTIVSPGSNPNGDGLWTDFTINADLQVHGVPEPATFLLLGLGVMLLRQKRSA